VGLSRDIGASGGLGVLVLLAWPSLLFRGITGVRHAGGDFLDELLWLVMLLLDGSGQRQGPPLEI